MVNGATPAARPLLPGSKALNEAALRRSVVEARRPEEGAFPGGGMTQSLLWAVATSADEFEPWGRNIKKRDNQLRAFIPTENVFASALGTVVARNAAFSWTLDGPERTAKHFHDVLENANGGEGWVDLVAKVSMDLYSQDNSAFIEIVRQQDAPNAPVIALNHLDAFRCWHTGIPQTPVLYQDRLARWHLIPWYNVLTLSELPTPIESYYGLQICALSRILRAAQIIKNINLYKYEKTGGRHTRRIDVVRGLSTPQIEQGLQRMVMQADNQGLQRFIMPYIFGTVDPAIDLQHITIDFVSMPDGYNEETTFKQYINMIALGFLEDYQTFAPLPGGNLGTSTQSEILAEKAKGKGPGLFRKILATALNQKVLPGNIEFVWEEQDQEAEKQEAEIKSTRATTRKTRIESGEITPEVAQLIAKDEGDLSEEHLALLGGTDVTRDVVLSDDLNPDAEIGNDRPSPEARTAVDGLEDVEDLLAGMRGRVFPLLLAGVKEDDTRVRLGEFLQTRIHRAFTTAADDLAALGYMDTAGRIQLSSIIGDALKTFARLVDEEAAETARRELSSEDVRRVMEATKAAALQHRAGGPEVDEARLSLEEEVAERIGPAIRRIQEAVRSQLIAP